MELDYVRLKEIKPQLASYIREAKTLLKKYPVPDDEVVHDIRILMKKARAVLKLVGPQLDNLYADKDIPSLKEAAGILAPWRDTTVLRKTLKELRKEYPGIFSHLLTDEKITALMKKHGRPMEVSSEVLTGIENIENLLSKTGYRIRFQNMNNIDPRILIKELEGTYMKVSDIFLTCRNNPKETKLHEFRKKSKDLLYQLYFFRPLNITVIKSLEKKLEGMTRSLGKVNDLSQLIKAVDYSYPDDSNKPAMDELVLRIREKQDQYLARVWPVAFKIFCPGKKLVNVLGFKLLII